VKHGGGLADIKRFLMCSDELAARVAGQLHTMLYGPNADKLDLIEEAVKCAVRIIEKFHMAKLHFALKQRFRMNLGVIRKRIIRWLKKCQGPQPLRVILRNFSMRSSDAKSRNRKSPERFHC
jgi:hypothetical protein